MNGIDIAVTLRHQVTSDMMLIQTRQEFSQNAMASLNAGSEKIELKDLGDEAANLLALQIRQQLSETVEPLASEAQQSLLKQF
jgi:protein subunit release factor B